MVSTRNDFLFGSNGVAVSPMLPVIITTKQQAFRTAAWLQLMGEVLPNEPDEPTEYGDILQAIGET